MDGDIGTFWKVIGSFTLIATVGLLWYGFSVHHEFTKIDMILFLGLIVTGLALLRPAWLDGAVKTLADRLPFFSYKKPPDA